MKMLRLMVLSAVLAMAVGAAKADPLSVMTVQEVSTSDQDAYVAMIAKINAAVKARIGVETYRHVWVGDFAGNKSHAIFIVSSYPSAAAVFQTNEKLKDATEIQLTMAQMKDMRKLGASTLYKAVREEGVYAGGSVFNTSIAVTDEAAYLKALDGLKAIFDANGFKDAKLNVYRDASGRTAPETHLVVISFPTSVRTGEFIDAIYDKGLLNEWNVTAAKFRTSLGNGSYHEITK